MGRLINFITISLLFSSQSIFVTPLSRAQNFEHGFSDLIKKLGPGVVNVSTYLEPSPSSPGSNNRLRKFFGEFDGDTLPPWRDPLYSAKLEPFLFGTGFIINENGLVLTSDDTIKGAKEVKVQISEDEELISAKVIGHDPELNVALLKIKNQSKLFPLPLGDSDKLEVGESVITIGNPLGYGHSVSHGILSAKERPADSETWGGLLQTDAAINPGSSGGPLINMRGEVIGINIAVASDAQGIGLAVPIKSVKMILPQLIETGSVSRGYFGISVNELTPGVLKRLRLPKTTKGVIVIEVMKGQPAKKAGIKPYDIVTTLNDDDIITAQELTEKIAALIPGKKAKISIIRKGRVKTLSVKAAKRHVRLSKS